MSELSAALRQFADRVDQMDFAPTSLAVVLTDGVRTNATYIGRELPVDAALTHLLARGIEHTVVSRLQGKIDHLGTSRGSTH